MELFTQDSPSKVLKFMELFARDSPSKVLKFMELLSQDSPSKVLKFMDLFAQDSPSKVLMELLSQDSLETPLGGQCTAVGIPKIPGVKY